MKNLDNRIFLVSLLFLFLFFTALTACGEKGGGGDPKECLPPCEEGEECVDGECLPIGCDPECEDGEECINGECLPIGCDPECEDGEECINGECLPSAATLSAKMERNASTVNVWWLCAIHHVMQESTVRQESVLPMFVIHHVKKERFAWNMVGLIVNVSIPPVESATISASGTRKKTERFAVYGTM